MKHELKTGKGLRPLSFAANGTRAKESRELTK
jgi:hypothetical protein